MRIRWAEPPAPTQADYDLTDEEIVPVAGFESRYLVSNFGYVMSLHGTKPKRLTPVHIRGYERVNLRDAPASRLVYVHHLVLDAFFGSRRGRDTRHLDGNPKNNHIVNLMWRTPLENSQDRYRHGTIWYAQRRGSCVNGHPYDEANTYRYASGAVRCRTCRREGMRAYYRAKKEQS